MQTWTLMGFDLLFDKSTYYTSHRATDKHIELHRLNSHSLGQSHIPLLVKKIARIPFQL
jgi:hypothetical protein